MTISPYRKLTRAWAFARHVPARQIGYRAALLLRRAWEQRGFYRREAPTPRFVDGHTPPIFAPRRNLARIAGGELVTHFVGDEERLPRPIDWSHIPATRSVQLWRMNLHYMEFLEGVDDAAFVEFIEAWIAANPPHRRAARADAWNAYALSIRVVVWCQQLSVRRQRLPHDFVRQVLGSIARQIRYLMRHLERDIGGNHLVKNIKALLIAARHFEGREAARWRARGLSLLRRAIREQFLPDGMHFELSPSYHCQVVSDLLEIHAVLDPEDQRTLLAVLHRGMAVVVNLVHPDGLVAQFSDSGLHMAYSPAEIVREFSRIAGEAPACAARFAFPAAGYFGCRDDYGNLLAVDAGRIAADRLPAHGHGDIFSFEWSVARQRIVVDQGVFEYVAGARRDRSRMSSSHNTLSIGGMEQGEFYGAFRLGHRAAVTVRDRSDRRQLEISGSHDGFIRYGGPTVTRRFSGHGGAFRIDDTIDRPQAVPVRAGMLLAPDAAAERISTGKVRITCGRATAVIAGSFDIVIEPAVWWPDMGIEIPTARLVMEWPRSAVAASLTFATGDGQREQ